MAHKEGDLTVWWVPQVPMQAFEAEVNSVEEGVKVLNVLARYDLFQLEHSVKPDFCNAGGLRRWCSDIDGTGMAGWEDWYDIETGEDDPEEFVKLREKAAKQALADGWVNWEGKAIKLPVPGNSIVEVEWIHSGKTEKWNAGCANGKDVKRYRLPRSQF